MSDIPLRIDVPKTGKPFLTIVLAHGAGAGMDSAFMKQVAEALAEASFRVARFEFPYMQQARATGKRSRPDPGAVLEETWFRVIEQVGPAEGLVIGGKSMGGRIASMVADRAGVKGLVCLGYPFHPGRKTRFTPGCAPGQSVHPDTRRAGYPRHAGKQGGDCPATRSRGPSGCTTWTTATTPSSRGRARAARTSRTLRRRWRQSPISAGDCDGIWPGGPLPGYLVSCGHQGQDSWRSSSWCASPAHFPSGSSRSL